LQYLEEHINLADQSRLERVDGSLGERRADDSAFRTMNISVEGIEYIEYPVSRDQLVGPGLGDTSVIAVYVYSTLASPPSFHGRGQCCYLGTQSPC
jgi:hypothetical protein